jgi:hypothetical protein
MRPLAIQAPLPFGHGLCLLPWLVVVRDRENLFVVGHEFAHAYHWQQRLLAWPARYLRDLLRDGYAAHACEQHADAVGAAAAAMVYAEHKGAGASRRHALWVAVVSLIEGGHHG